MTYEHCLEHADHLAQDVVNAWAVQVQAGNSKHLTEAFKDLFETTCRYRTTHQYVENHRAFNILSDTEAADEKLTREEFARHYQAYYTKHVEES